MTDITELAQSLKALANNAGADYWQAKKIVGDFYVIRKGSYKRECGYSTYQPIAEIDHKPTRDYVAMANPANVLALVEALEKAQQRIAELESRTVKLPDLRQIVSGDRYVWSDGVYNYSQDVKVALAAAGIKVEAE
ncbi:TPA: ead/Ea22-like family protein [Klebsiella pneumoniae]|uniref:ead/Ea22-like family protein n=1 Tax=Klebsiella pneumoniae TaxID=573 RepID=UPI00228C8694|nr:ead/Ea22-like family protein [Klebsiella pneumoniae]HBW2337075.1 ead/Ea22-like family protein [Klebsiella pneumoniae]HBZ8471212.1 ead/Ea22-like family protein [Klebsiella pneumoniae]HCJ1211559.1 ead/Ea22-like family protein [Klebsiella pneumoniae]HCM5561515.1 ead/Ea22-like family protein [Klebsiella pneumoniae]